MGSPAYLRKSSVYGYFPGNFSTGGAIGPISVPAVPVRLLAKRSLNFEEPQPHRDGITT